MQDDRAYVERARAVLETRASRNALFPGALFEEDAWGILVHLFIAHATGAAMSEADVIACGDTGRLDGQRWLYHLMQDGQISPRRSGDDVVLTSGAIERMRLFLSHHQIASKPTRPS